MTEVKTISGEVLFSYDETVTTLRVEILKYKDLSGADLRWANLQGANLSGANLKGANLRRACIGYANLRNANLIDADLSDAEIIGADLTFANLSGANLEEANLVDADISWAILKGASLRGANLIDADLSNAKLDGADINGAYLCYAMNVPDGLPMVCPEEGSFVAWKKVNDRYIIKLEIPEDAKRSSATSKKCRCNKAKVLEITNMFTGEKIDEVVNRSYAPCTYTVGKMVYPDWFDNNRWNECSHGIHFFVDREEAVDYYN